MLHFRHFTFAALCVLLAGCVSSPGASSDAASAQNGTPVGYHYYDANHPDGVHGASPQAIYNAAHGTWLWPPQDADVP